MSILPTLTTLLQPIQLRSNYLVQQLRSGIPVKTIIDNEMFQLQAQKITEGISTLSTLLPGLDREVAKVKEILVKIKEEWESLSGNIFSIRDNFSSDMSHPHLYRQTTHLQKKIQKAIRKIHKFSFAHVNASEELNPLNYFWENADAECIETYKQKASEHFDQIIRSIKEELHEDLENLTPIAGDYAIVQNRAETLANLQIRMQTLRDKLFGPTIDLTLRLAKGVYGERLKKELLEKSETLCTLEGFIKFIVIDCFRHYRVDLVKEITHFIEQDSERMLEEDFDIEDLGEEIARLDLHEIEHIFYDEQDTYCLLNQKLTKFVGWLVHTIYAYGDKEEGLKKEISDLQEVWSEELNNRFEEYESTQFEQKYPIPNPPNSSPQKISLEEEEESELSSQADSEQHFALSIELNRDELLSQLGLIGHDRPTPTGVELFEMLQEMNSGSYPSLLISAIKTILDPDENDIALQATVIKQLLSDSDSVLSFIGKISSPIQSRQYLKYITVQSLIDQDQDAYLYFSKALQQYQDCKDRVILSRFVDLLQEEEKGQEGLLWLVKQIAEKESNLRKRDRLLNKLTESIEHKQEHFSVSPITTLSRIDFIRHPEILEIFYQSDLAHLMMRHACEVIAQENHNEIEEIDVWLNDLSDVTESALDKSEQIKKIKHSLLNMKLEMFQLLYLSINHLYIDVLSGKFLQPNVLSKIEDLSNAKQQRNFIKLLIAFQIHNKQFRSAFLANGLTPSQIEDLESQMQALSSFEIQEAIFKKKGGVGELLEIAVDSPLKVILELDRQSLEYNQSLKRFSRLYRKQQNQEQDTGLESQVNSQQALLASTYEKMDIDDQVIETNSKDYKDDDNNIDQVEEDTYFLCYVNDRIASAIEVDCIFDYLPKITKPEALFNYIISLQDKYLFDRICRILTTKYALENNIELCRTLFAIIGRRYDRQQLLEFLEDSVFEFAYLENGGRIQLFCWHLLLQMRLDPSLIQDLVRIFGFGVVNRQRP